ncbi:hypothetical protein Syun_009065 [Stephania yunnanensis]|uniref:Uncharacterized protein n=1 Tax=Stephania yunnanensis TaxID=152371 RepID=A0AAP0KDP8_9MAGN
MKVARQSKDKPKLTIFIKPKPMLLKALRKRRKAFSQGLIQYIDPFHKALRSLSLTLNHGDSNASEGVQIVQIEGDDDLNENHHQTKSLHAMNSSKKLLNWRTDIMRILIDSIRPSQLRMGETRTIFDRVPPMTNDDGLGEIKVDTWDPIATVPEIEHTTEIKLRQANPLLRISSFTI